MILPSIAVPTETNGLKVQRFSIQNNAKAFQALSANLYTDKPTAILKELGANALDSHIAAGQPNKPFEIELPSYLDSTLKIRDFGVSMTHEFMENNYTAAFFSSKDTANTQNGSWGLGRLAPLSLVDGYDVVCYLDGEERGYTVFKDSDGAPSISLLYSTETAEPNGVLVKVAVPSNFSGEFETKAKMVFEFFPTAPVISSDGSSVEIVTTKAIYRSKKDRDWEFTGEQRSRAVMGCYSYPINTYSISNHLSETQRLFLDGGVNLYFELGEISFTPSREAISYDSITIKAITDKLADMEKEIPAILEESFAGCETMYQAKCNFYVISDSCHGNLRRLIGLRGLEWRGEKLKDCYLDIPADFHRIFYSLYPQSFDRRFKSLSFQKMAKPDASVNILANRKNVFIWNDTGVVCNNQAELGMRIFDKYKELKNGMSSRPNISLISLLECNALTLERIRNEFLGTSTEILKLSDFPVNPTYKAEYAAAKEEAKKNRVPRAKNNKYAKKVFRYNGNRPRGRGHSNSWETVTDLDLSKVNYYVRLDHFAPSMAGGTQDLFYRNYKVLCQILGADSILGIKSDANISDNNLVRVTMDLIKTRLQDIYSQNKEVFEIHSFYHRSYKRHIADILLKYPEFMEVLGLDELVFDKTFKACQEFASEYSIYFGQPTTKMQDLCEKYPILKIANSEASVDDIALYLRLQINKENLDAANDLA